MNKADLVEKVAAEARLTKKDAQYATEVVFEKILEALVNGEEVKIAGFGSFVVKERAARVGINPTTKEKIEIPAMKAVVFKAAKPAKDKVNG